MTLSQKKETRYFLRRIPNKWSVGGRSEAINGKTSIEWSVEMGLNYLMHGCLCADLWPTEVNLRTRTCITAKVQSVIQYKWPHCYEPIPQLFDIKPLLRPRKDHPSASLNQYGQVHKAAQFMVTIAIQTAQEHFRD